MKMEFNTPLRASLPRWDREAGDGFAEGSDGAGELDPLHLAQRQTGRRRRQQPQHLGVIATFMKGSAGVEDMIHQHQDMLNQMAW